MWPAAPLEHPAAPALLRLRPTARLRHAALAPLLIYTPVGEGVNAEESAKKNLICSPSLKGELARSYRAAVREVMVFLFQHILDSRLINAIFVHH